MEPCGTPNKISVYWDNKSPYCTNWFLFDKLLTSSCSAAPVMP